ncbi:MAG: AraC family transcriptional regulator [Lachnospiraceae bacterium]
MYKNSYKLEGKSTKGLYVCNVGHQICEPGYQWGPGIREHYILHHITSGKGVFQCGGTNYELKAGDSFLIYPYEEVLYYADQAQPWEYSWVGFKGSESNYILGATAFEIERPVVYGVKQSSKIKQNMQRIYEERGSLVFNEASMTGRLYLVLCEFMRTHRVEETPLYSSYVEEATDYIDTHYAFQITIQEVADYVGLSRSHLYRVFEEGLACSPKDYLIKTRMEQAQRLLRNTNLAIATVAKSVGYEDGLNFSKAFKKVYGISPSEYKKGEIK